MRNEMHAHAMHFLGQQQASSLRILLLKIVGFTYMIEILGDKQRSYMAIISLGGFAVGELLLAYPFAVSIHDWRKLQFWISFAAIPSIVLPCFIPNSYRWLVSKN